MLSVNYICVSCVAVAAAGWWEMMHDLLYNYKGSQWGVLMGLASELCVNCIDFFTL